MITCKGCDARKAIFELFTTLNVPIPVNNKIPIIVTVVPRFAQAFKIGLYISRFKSIRKFATKVSKLSGVIMEKLLIAEVINRKLATFFDTAFNEPIIEHGINSDTAIYAYEAHRSIEMAEEDGKRAKPLQKEINQLYIGDQMDFCHKGIWKIARVNDLRDGTSGLEFKIQLEDSEYKQEF